MNLIEHNKRVYNKIATHFSNTRRTLWKDLVPLGKYTKEGNRVLDVGCGNGRLYHLFEKKQIQYVGIDQSRGLIAIARKKLTPSLPRRQAGLPPPTRGRTKIRFVLGEMTKLPFKKAEFDIVYCIAAFHHLPDETSRVKALKEMKRVLKKNGTLVMTNWNLTNVRTAKITKLRKISEDSWRDFMVPWRNDTGEVLGDRYYHAFTSDELSGLFLEAGFVVLDHYYTSKGKRCDDASMSGNIVHVASST